MDHAKRAAVERTIYPWLWLIEHPDKEKEDYYKLSGIYPLDDEHGCFLCDEFRIETEKMVRCTGCPLSTPSLSCKRMTSPWVQWEMGINRVKQANRIVAACKIWIEDRCS